MILPQFQPQNPALNGYILGWSSCTAYSGAMAAAFDRQTKIVMTGESLRRKTGDVSGGLNLAQIDLALNSGWSIDLAVHYRLPWAMFAKFIDAGMGGVLQGWYAPIADSRFDAGRGFRGNHAIFVPPGWGAMDPLADGRASGVYKYHAEAYPRSLLRSYAGKLNLAASGYRALGDGYVYAAMTKDQVHTYTLLCDGGAFWVYNVSVTGKITSRYAKRFSAPVRLTVTPPRWYQWPALGPTQGRTLVQVIGPSRSSLYQEHIAIPQNHVKLEVVP